MPGHGPSGIGKVASRAAPISSAPRMHGLGRVAQLVVVERLVPPTTTTSAREANSRVVDDPQAGLGDVVHQRLRADHERGAAAALGEQ